ncbi:hypothetical protein RJE46_13320 [Cedecea neteri]|uniref:Secreted protein n=1 Tax=Cedecea neteri TaxID=158822 RepID=A0AAN0S678_9ENTR|nr:hypothetical protein [Cedecea neteri]AIR61954.1 hypothetical protein LH23_15235 [Cedecea neteri]NIG73814.1 hypothetical protein [Klebsiella sp. Ap-873]WNJ77619.1 hypothetical protein RJE46_13320 [Cedecea neteri]
MTKKWGFAVVAVLAAAGVVMVSGFTSSVPPYVSAAQDRVESYLSYSFGPQHCSSNKQQSGEWDILCITQDGSSQFAYSVNDASDKAYGFTLTALNDRARQTQNVDLLTYLEIKSL